MSYLVHYFDATWSLIAEMGPYLLLGFAVAGILHRLISEAWIERHLGGNGFRSITLASLFGVPMPLCSCGVIPVTASLRNKGASKGAAASFLTSTPQTGVDSILATWGMLGPVFAIYRVIVAFLSGLIVGGAVNAIGGRSKSPETPSANAPTHATDSEERPSWRGCLRYGLVTLPSDIAGSLFIGFLLAGLIAALAPDNLLANLAGGLIASILLTTLIATPFYICSTGSIPLAIALIEKGLPVASALVLLIAGPATNVATIVTMRRALGNRETIAYVGSIVLISWIAAYLFQIFLATGTTLQHIHEHSVEIAWWKHLSGGTLLLIIAYGYWKTRHSRSRETVESPTNSEGPMNETARLSISGMTCTHCRQSVVDGLKSLENAAQVDVDLASGEATVSGSQLRLDDLVAKIESLGFSVTKKELQKA